MERSPDSSRFPRLVLVCAVFGATLTLRIWDVASNSLVLRDQMRDWDLVQGPFRALPLLGPATHVGGYTIGPAFYWILWLIRVTFGPWFDNLPHAGGIGQAVLQSLVDALLLVALWRRTGSAWLSTAIVILVATASFDLSFAATIWNPVVGSTLAKCAIALVLLDWHRRGPWRVMSTVAVAWMAVHAYTGAIYVAVAVIAACVLDPLRRTRRHDALRQLSLVTAVIAALQTPYGWFQVTTGFRTAAMGAVSGSLHRVLTGDAAPEFGKSVDGLLDAFTAIQLAPWHAPALPLLVTVAAAIVAIRYRRDPALLLITLLPPTLAIVGYALFLSRLDHYYYLSVMPSLVLTVTLALTAWPRPAVAHVIAMLLCGAALALSPLRFAAARTMNKMPEYGMLVRASRVLVHRDMPMRAVRTTFRLPPTGDSEYLYRLLGGRIDPTATWMAEIDRDGTITYRAVSGG